MSVLIFTLFRVPKRLDNGIINMHFAKQTESSSTAFIDATTRYPDHDASTHDISCGLNGPDTFTVSTPLTTDLIILRHGQRDHRLAFPSFEHAFSKAKLASLNPISAQTRALCGNRIGS